MPLTHVLSPLTIKGVTFKNRVVRPAHGTHLGQTRLNDDLIYYHEARARGGVGLTILEAAGVHPSGPLTLHSFDDSIIEPYKTLMALVEPHGMRVFQQLQHLGSESAPIGGGAPWSASAVMSQGLRQPCHAMTKAEIRELVDAFAAAARRAQRGGLHGVELHCAHGYLMQQFLSPLTNHRDDEYGGTFENRLRFTVETLSAIRQSVGGDFIVGARFGTEVVAGGHSPDDIKDIVQAIVARGVVDYVNISHGGIFAPHKIIGGMHEPTGYEIPASRVATRAAGVPTIVTGRFRTLADADAVIAAGDAQMVGMTRAHIADPDIVRKTTEGRPEEIRPCIGCNQRCVGGIAGENGWGRLDCTVNVAIGAEQTLADDRLDRVATPRRILVVGGGPAGMEAARIAALRGHKVVLADAKPALGGTIALARLAPFHAGIGDIADWLAREIARLGVEIRLGLRIDRAFVEALKPDAVILATGAAPAVVNGAIPGLASAPKLSTEDILTGARTLPEAVLIIDEVGAYEGIGAAEGLTERGKRVTFVTSFPVFAPKMLATLAVTPALERLQRGRFLLMTGARVLRVGAGEALVQPGEGGPPRAVSADALVTIYPKPANRALAEALSPLGLPVHVVGDAGGQRFLPTAIREGNMAARLV